MTEQIFTVFDSKTAAFLQPFFAPTIEAAIRMFRTIVNTEGHQFQMYPDDYTLFHVGQFHQESGAIVGNNTPVSLGLAVTFLDHGSQIPLKLEEA